MSVSRRKFLGQSVAGWAAFSIVPRHVVGKGFLAPSDQLTKALSLIHI
jgi:myo-inositol 2-dehydrogenase/D-chiro-inositol 1-dehydrogenase